MTIAGTFVNTDVLLVTSKPGTAFSAVILSGNCAPYLRWGYSVCDSEDLRRAAYWDGGMLSLSIDRKKVLTSSKN